MKVRWRKSLKSRLLASLGLAALLPLAAVLALALVLVYQASTAQTYQSLEQVSARYAAEVSADLSEKFGEVRSLAALDSVLDEPALLSRTREIDPEIRHSWIRREGVTVPGEDEFQKALYQAVRVRGTEVLSEPDPKSRTASLGVPLVRQGRFNGMLAVTFSLDSFQALVNTIRLGRTGYGFLVSHAGIRIAHPDATLVGVRIGNDVDQTQADRMLRLVYEGRPFSFEKIALLTGVWSRQSYAPIAVGRSWDPWFFVSVVPVAEANEGINLLFAVLASGMVLTLALVAWAAWAVAGSLVRPLQELAATAETVAEGQLEARVTWRSEDEIGHLAASFNRMTDRLAEALRNQEDLVRARTASLRQSLAELEQAQTKIVDTEKMAVLGQLTATIAHEINTPLGAIRSSATFLHQSGSNRFGDLPEFFRRLPPGDLAWYKALVLQKGVDLSPPTGAEDRKRRRALAVSLREARIPDPEGLADDIVFLVPPEEDASLVKAAVAGRGEVIRRAAEACSQQQSSSIILEAADRAAGTVAALVDYARSRDVRTDDLVDPAREFDTLMTLYYGVSKKGVEVVRLFEPGAQVKGDRDKLNQVWVNLINNALQAMNYRGVLTLRTRVLAHGVEVSVLNNGPPVPPALREKIFEPFFTTKRAGEGTGLGLDICRRIVEAHHGSLVHSDEGSLTCFTVRLPFATEERSSP